MAVAEEQKRGLYRTGRKGLLELLGLVGVLENKGVEVLAAADLELGLSLRSLLVLLYPRGCIDSRLAP